MVSASNYYGAPSGGEIMIDRLEIHAYTAHDAIGTVLFSVPIHNPPLILSPLLSSSVVAMGFREEPIVTPRKMRPLDRE